MQLSLENKIPDVEVRLSSLSKDETKAIIVAFSDRSRELIITMIYKKDELTMLAELSPWLKTDDMAKMSPVKYESRDGLIIHGYLTLPVNYNKGNRIPVVVNPHGGPWVRDYWGFNSEIQFLANKGYAVFQMNYRGQYRLWKKFLGKRSLNNGVKDMQMI